MLLACDELEACFAKRNRAIKKGDYIGKDRIHERRTASSEEDQAGLLPHVKESMG